MLVGRIGLSGSESEGLLNNRITVGYYLSFISLGLMLNSLGPTLPDLAEQTGSSLSQIGILFTARSLGSLCGNFLVGHIYDRWPGHPFYAGMLLVMGAMLALTPVVSLLWMLTGVFFVMGISESAINVGGNTLVVWVHGDQVGPFMNALHLFFGVGGFLAPLIIAGVASLTGAYWILALLMLPAAVWLYRLPSPVNQSRSETADAPFDVVLVGLIALFMFFMAGGILTMGGWLVTYARELDLASKTTATYLYAGVMGSVVVGRLVGIPIATRFRPKQIIMVDLLGMLASLILLILWQRPVILWVGVMLHGFSAASVFPAAMSYAGQQLHLTGNITSWFMVGVSLGGMILPWLMGHVFEAGHADWLMACLALNMLVVLGIFLALNGYTGRAIVAKVEVV